LWPLLAGLLVTPGHAFAESDAPDRSKRWLPSIALKGGGGFQDHEGDVSSTCEVGGIGNPNFGVANCIGPTGGGVPGPAPLRKAESGSDHSVFPFVGANIQLMSPAIEMLPGRPSIFISGELNLAFPPFRNVVNEGDPTGVRLPPLATGNTAVPALSLAGTGSRTSSEIQRLVWGAGIGLAFPFEFLGRQMRVKPSANWIHYEVDVTGTVLAGLKDDPSDAIPPWGANRRDIDLSGSDTIVVDAIGPGLELEMDVGDVGPVGASIFMGANAYRVLGKRDVKLTDEITATGDGLPDDTYTAEWNYEVDPWVYGADVGIRFSLIGH
jgi:hypothetical protein